jgi:hypothetical protein
MNKLKRYRLVLLISIVLNLVVGVWIAVAPVSFTGLLHQTYPVPQTWPRHWGFQLWAINFLYLPGYRDPLNQRWPNWCGIGIRIVFALFFFSQGDGFVRPICPFFAPLIFGPDATARWSRRPFQCKVTPANLSNSQWSAVPHMASAGGTLMFVCQLFTSLVRQAPVA